MSPPIRCLPHKVQDCLQDCPQDCRSFVAPQYLEGLRSPRCLAIVTEFVVKLNMGTLAHKVAGVGRLRNFISVLWYT